MAYLEYMLLAILGSPVVTTQATTNEGSLMQTFTADAVTQPSGGTEGEGYLNAPLVFLGQATGGSSGHRSGTGRKGRVHTRRGHKHAKVAGAGSKVSSSTPGTGGVKPNMNAQPRPPRPRRASNSNKNSK